jgi:hypothetical protein
VLGFKLQVLIFELSKEARKTFAFRAQFRAISTYFDLFRDIGVRFPSSISRYFDLFRAISTYFEIKKFFCDEPTGGGGTYQESGFQSQWVRSRAQFNRKWLDVDLCGFKWFACSKKVHQKPLKST